MTQQLSMVRIDDILKSLKSLKFTDVQMTAIERCLHRTYRRLMGVRRKRPKRDAMYRTPDGCFMYDEAALSDGQMVMLNDSVWMDYIRAALSVPRNGRWYKILDSEVLTPRLKEQVSRHIREWFSKDTGPDPHPNICANAWGVYVRRMPKGSVLSNFPCYTVPAAGPGLPGDSDTEQS